MNKPINVLVLEDRETDAEIMIRELQRAGFSPKWKRVQTEPDFLDEIKNLPDIILSDYSMPQFSGLRAAEILQTSGLNIPFILISGAVGEDIAVQAMRHGATDYLLKDRLGRLGLAVERALEQKLLRNERDQAEEALRKELERSNRELQDFAQVASHDLQEPLRKILSFGNRLKTKAGDSLDEECGDCLQRMTSAAARMQILIRDLMEFSRVDIKGQPFVNADLGSIAREVSNDLESRVEQAGGRIEIEALPTIDADPMQMRQLLQNLIGNSLKYYRPGVPPVVRIYSQNLDVRREGSIRDGAQPQQLCELSVADNGIGFDEKYLDRIFTVFQRLHNKTEYEGTGIGLAICRKIVDRHRGTITARSSPGQGATFVVTLPVMQPKEVGVL